MQGSLFGAGRAWEDSSLLQPWQPVLSRARDYSGAVTGIVAVLPHEPPGELLVVAQLKESHEERGWHGAGCAFCTWAPSVRPAGGAGQASLSSPPTSDALNSSPACVLLLCLTKQNLFFFFFFVTVNN